MECTANRVDDLLSENSSASSIPYASECSLFWWTLWLIIEMRSANWQQTDYLPRQQSFNDNCNHVLRAWTRSVSAAVWLFIDRARGSRTKTTTRRAIDTAFNHSAVYARFCCGLFFFTAFNNNWLSEILTETYFLVSQRWMVKRFRLIETLTRNPMKYYIVSNENVTNVGRWWGWRTLQSSQEHFLVR